MYSIDEEHNSVFLCFHLFECYARSAFESNSYKTCSDAYPKLNQKP